MSRDVKFHTRVQNLCFIQTLNVQLKSLFVATFRGRNRSNMAMDATTMNGCLDILLWLKKIVFGQNELLNLNAVFGQNELLNLNA
jgi:hypothetical protein